MRDKLEKKLAVVKVGGDVVLDDKQRNGLTQNVKSLIDTGWKVIILHGGGPQVSQSQSVLGIKSQKVNGRRITSARDLSVVKQVIAGEVNVNLVSALVGAGVDAFGFHGASGKVILAEKRPPMLFPNNDEPIDFGEVGDVLSIRHELLLGILELNVVPVIATLGINHSGRVFNINADTTVVKIAQTLSADMLLLVTGVGAIFRDVEDKSSRIKSINKPQARELIHSEVIKDGMVPKVEEAFGCLNHGVKRIVILSASDEKAFESAALGQDLYGTTLY